jgi:hypothetical protein
VLLDRRGPGDDGGGRTRQGHPDGRLQQTLRSRLSAVRRGAQRPPRTSASRASPPWKRRSCPMSRITGCTVRTALPRTLRTAFAADNAARIAAAIGEVDPLSAHAYHLVLLDSLVHEFNAVRGVLGEPDGWPSPTSPSTASPPCCASVPRNACSTGSICPGIARYAMEFAFYAPHARLTACVPVAVPAQRAHAADARGRRGRHAARSWRTEEITAYDESFREELLHFHACVTSGQRANHLGPTRCTTSRCANP